MSANFLRPYFSSREVPGSTVARLTNHRYPPSRVTLLDAMADGKLPYNPVDASQRGPSCCDKFRSGVVEFFIWFAWLCLEVTNVILHVLFGISALFKSCAGICSPKKEEKHVVIVGASFGGLAAQRELSGLPGLKVTLVDFKDYFEYTPGVLRCLVQPSWLKELTKPLPSSRNELLTAAMTGATGEAVVVKGSDGAQRRLPLSMLDKSPTVSSRASSWSV